MTDALLSFDRRRFLAAASASAVLPMTPLLADDAEETTVNPDNPRLRALRLATAAPLPAMRRFYHDVLEFPVVTETEDELTVGAGRTLITFVRARADEGAPFYHVAFNIPENKLMQARSWQLERTKLKLRRPGSSTHPKYDDVAVFNHWNAHAVFFWDPADNLLEYIARHDLDNAATGPFTSKDILYASEVSFMTDDVAATAGALGTALGLRSYAGVNPGFHPLGDEHGLLLVFPTGRQWRKADGTGRPAEVYPTEVTIRSATAGTHEVPGRPWRIVREQG